MTRPELAEGYAVMPGALHSSPDALTVYSKTPQGEQLLTITKNVTKIRQIAGGHICLYGRSGRWKAALYDHTDNPDPRVINLAQLVREAAERQGIPIIQDTQEDQS